MAGEIHGVEEARAKMRQLGNSRKIKNACTRSARKAMNEVIKKPVKEKAKTIDDPKSPYKIWKYVTTKAGKSRDRNSVLMRVGVRGGGSVQKNPQGYHWRFVELGTSHHRAKPFLRPIFYNKQAELTQEFVKYFKKELDKEIEKARR